MNNYCTNCGKKLEEGKLVCDNCNVPIIDLSSDYSYDLYRKKRNKNRMKMVGICFLSAIVFILSKITIDKVKAKKIQNKYVDSYISENYNFSTYDVHLKRMGQCKIYSCDENDYNCGLGSLCCFDRYLENESCKSYTYYVYSSEKDFLVTVYYRNNTYDVIEGESIYGYE